MQFFSSAIFTKADVVLIGKISTTATKTNLSYIVVAVEITQGEDELRKEVIDKIRFIQSPRTNGAERKRKKERKKERKCTKYYKRSE